MCLIFQDDGVLSSLLCNIALEVLYTQNPTWNEYPKHEIKGTIISTIVSKSVKYLGINVTKEVQHLCSEAYKTLLQEKDLNPWENTVCLWVRRFDPIPQTGLQVVLAPPGTPAHSFAEINKLILIRDLYVISRDPE